MYDVEGCTPGSFKGAKNPSLTAFPNSKPPFILLGVLPE